MEQQRTCNRCDVPYEGDEVEACFPKDRDAMYTYRRTIRGMVCCFCKQIAKDKKKAANRPLQKARDALRRHADKYIRLGADKYDWLEGVTTRAEFARKFDWDLERMARDLVFHHGGRCDYCDAPFSSMALGLGDITLDVMYPDQPPYYRSNTKWVCGTCNREKAHTKPRLWEGKNSGGKKWRNRLPPRQGRLFPDDDSPD